MKYHQLTLLLRYQIQALIKEGLSFNAIAKHLGVHRSTVGREIKRNRLNDGEYLAHYAQVQTRLRYQAKTKNKKLTHVHYKYIRQKLKEGWSPEQISGRMAADSILAVSHETIYRYIYKRIKEGDKLHIYLRHKNRKYRSRKGIYELRGKIPRAKPISTRPKSAEDKKRIGDFEADTIIGKDHEQAIVTLVDKCSKFTLMRKVETKKADKTASAIISMLEPIKNIVKTITSDNGKEFAYFYEVEMRLGCDFYFADAYKSWQRGLNEHTNGLIREYIPKKTMFETVSDKQIIEIQDRLNHRPRKALGYKTPHEVFFSKMLEEMENDRLAAMLTEKAMDEKCVAVVG